MRFNFKKISAIASGLLLAGMTMGVAAAANYPSPFVVGSSSDVAIVYGTGTGVSTLDQVEATNIQTDLAGSLTGTGGTATASGGDSYLIEKENTKFHLGDNIEDVVSLTIDEDELPTLLDKGVFLDDDNDEFDFEQSIVLANLQLVLFEDNDYEDDVPTIGIIIDDSAVLNYTLEFTTTPEWDDLETAEITMMGREYYILDITNGSKLTLLDSASSAVVSEGESPTIEGKTVSISYIDSDEVVLTVDGEDTNSLNEGETQKLSDGSYVGIKDIRYAAVEGRTGSVELSLGTGKLILEDGQNVELNDDDVQEITVSIANDSGGDLETITLEWITDDKEFITEDTELTMPGFEAVKLSFGGMEWPTAEEFKISPEGEEVVTLDNFPTKEGTFDIPVLQWDQDFGNITDVGEDDGAGLLTGAADSILFDEDLHTWFVVTYESGEDCESYLVRASDIREDTNVDKNYTDIEYYDGSGWVKEAEDQDEDDDFTLGLAELDINEILDDDGTVNISTSDSNVVFDLLCSAEGLRIKLPVDGDDLTIGNITDGDSTYEFVIDEEDDDDDIAGVPGMVNVTVGLTGTDNETTVSSVTISGSDFEQTISDDVTEAYTYSALATKLTFDQSGDQDELTIEYHGGESEAQLFITAPEVVIAAGDGATLGNVVIMDTEVDTMSDKNLIIVGGSCINSAAATVLGGAYCGAAFTEATGVGSGQYMVKSYTSNWDASKIALLVAGYQVSDTQAASQYVRTQTFDTSTVDEIGTTATIV